MDNSSSAYTKQDALKILFENFAGSVPDTLALIVLDSEQNETIASFMQSQEESSTFEAVTASIKKVLDRLSKEMISGSSPVSFFDTDQNRLIFIKIKKVIFSIALALDASVDNALPYAFLTAEKVGHIMDGRVVELNIPLIKIVTDDEEQRRIRDHFFELRSSKGEFTFKLVVVGDANVGKTSLILRHAENVFKKNYLPTLGVSITTNSVELPLRNAKVNFSSWDFGGQNYFRRVRLSYYAGTQACFIVFDLTNRESFESIARWMEEREKFAGDVITVLLANKNDLADGRVVTEQELNELASAHGVSYFETSALTGANVEDAFNLMAYKLVDMELKKVETRQVNELKSELIDCVEDKGHLQFGITRNRKYFAPVLQVFLEMDYSPKISELNHGGKQYDFDMDISLVSLDILNDMNIDSQAELMAGMDGILGIYDTRRDTGAADSKTFVTFLRKVFDQATKPDFTGSIGVLCDKSKYSEYLAELDLDDVLKKEGNENKSVFFYNLSDNYLLEIMDNLKMFFESFSLI